MPPKKSKKAAGKGKSSAVVDGLSTDEMSKDQLEEHIVRLREELDREREERSYFQLERDKIQASWEICKRSLEEARAELRHREREREEAEERHRVEITVYKQKLKHVLSEHHSTVTALKTDGVAATALLQNHNTEAELRLRREQQGLQADCRESRLHNQELIKELRLKHQVELMELTNDYDRRFRELEMKYHRNMEATVQAEAKRRRAELSEVEDRMKSHVVTLMRNHEEALREAEEYYSHTHAMVLQEQQLLKDQFAEMKLQKQTDLELSAAERENRRLQRSLQEAEQQLPALQRRLQELNQEKAESVMSRARLKVMEKEQRDLTVEHELLLQAFEKVQQERDELLRRHTQTLLDVQQKCGLKELLLERKLAALTDVLTKKDAQLCTTLSASNVEHAAGSSAANKLEEMLQSLQVSVDAAQCDVEQDRQKYDDLLQTCQ